MNATVTMADGVLQMPTAWKWMMDPINVNAAKEWQEMDSDA